MLIELRLEKQVAKMHVSEQSQTVLLVELTFADGAQGKVILSENGIDFENCGDLFYSWGVPAAYTTLAFDGNWEAMSGDIAFEPVLQRTINVDIRYVLWVIDTYFEAGYLLDEMTFAK